MHPQVFASAVAHGEEKTGQVCQVSPFEDS